MPLAVAIVTPERPVLQREADFVVVPAWEGELGILQNHIPLIAQLREGSIRLKSGEDTDYFAISGGFVEVKDNTVSIFAETAELAQEIDLERARQAADRAKAAVRNARGFPPAEAEAALRRALVRLRIAESVRRQTQHNRP